MKDQTLKEAFDEFKFNPGDLVCHRTDVNMWTKRSEWAEFRRLRTVHVIISQRLDRMASGILEHNYYCTSFEGNPASNRSGHLGETFCECELELHEKHRDSS